MKTFNEIINSLILYQEDIDFVDELSREARFGTIDPQLLNIFHSLLDAQTDLITTIKKQLRQAHEYEHRLEAAKSLSEVAPVSIGSDTTSKD